MKRYLTLIVLAGALSLGACSKAPEETAPAPEAAKESAPPPQNSSTPPIAESAATPPIEAIPAAATPAQSVATDSGKAAPAASGKITAIVSTTLGDITLELDEAKAPVTVANFVSYANEGFFDGTLFHRVMEDFMVQGGGFTLTDDGDLTKKSTKAGIQNEAKNGLKNSRGTVSMARTSSPHSATAQFFINHKDNSNLDYPSFDGWGYAVFGKVVKGMDVVDKIAAVETTTLAPGQRGNNSPVPMGDVPVTDVFIQSVKIVE